MFCLCVVVGILPSAMGEGEGEGEGPTTATHSHCCLEDLSLAHHTR